MMVPPGTARGGRPGEGAVAGAPDSRRSRNAPRPNLPDATRAHRIGLWREHLAELIPGNGDDRIAEILMERGVRTFRGHAHWSGRQVCYLRKALERDFEELAD